MGKILLVLGLFLAAVGLALSYAPWLVSWFGTLPGDIKVKRENSFIFIPITSMLLVSVVVSMVLNLFFRR